MGTYCNETKGAEWPPRTGCGKARLTCDRSELWASRRLCGTEAPVRMSLFQRLLREQQRLIQCPESLITCAESPPSRGPGDAPSTAAGDPDATETWRSLPSRGPLSCGMTPPSRSRCVV